jgi:hypothetical protein
MGQGEGGGGGITGQIQVGAGLWGRGGGRAWLEWGLYDKETVLQNFWVYRQLPRVSPSFPSGYVQIFLKRSLFFAHMFAIFENFASPWKVKARHGFISVYLSELKPDLEYISGRK